jgi:hypothetical protein
LGAAIIVILMVGAFVIGERAHAAAEPDQAIAIEEENHTFCTSLRLEPASEVYGRCTDGLISIRQRQKEEILRSERGIFWGRSQWRGAILPPPPVVNITNQFAVTNNVTLDGRAIGSAVTSIVMKDNRVINSAQSDGADRFKSRKCRKP